MTKEEKLKNAKKEKALLLKIKREVEIYDPALKKDLQKIADYIYFHCNIKRKEFNLEKKLEDYQEKKLSNLEEKNIEKIKEMADRKFEDLMFQNLINYFFYNKE